MEKILSKKITCYHCGEDCSENAVRSEGRSFCCEGCRMVYEILDNKGLCRYYDINDHPGTSQRIHSRKDKFAFLDDQNIQKKLIVFSDGKESHVRFYLPQVHCSSCIWLLENLSKIEPAIHSSRVHFPKKEITIVYNEQKIPLRKLAELLTAIGYEPHISLDDVSDHKKTRFSRARIFKLGIAGFCFGNIMMLSFPEYFSAGDFMVKGLGSLFSYLNLALALPVLFYSASEFYLSAWKGLRQRTLNIDAPITLAILITFTRSVYEILTSTGPGYLDSMSGIVFFMLIGRLFQDRSWQELSFDRDYRSFFPVSVTVKKGKEEVSVPISDLKEGDRMLIRNNELIPADAILFLGHANIDYSFVTGESIPAERSIGEIIYAGGKQIGGAIELEVIRSISQSHLTQLWNKHAFRNKPLVKQESFTQVLSQYFTIILFTIAGLTAVYWALVDPSKLMQATTAVLIVACPCALLLSAVFTNGSVLRIFGKNGFYLRNASVIEAIANADTVVLDKTGTITHGTGLLVFEGKMPDLRQQQLLRSLAIQSNHPLSRTIVNQLPSSSLLKVKLFHEYPGKGIEGYVDGIYVKIGSAGFLGLKKEVNANGTHVHVKIDDLVIGRFILRQQYRPCIEQMLERLGKDHRLILLSGDNSAEHRHLQELLGAQASLLFNNTPTDKLEYIDSLKKSGRKVMMIGDGLNDAGALVRSDAGIAIADDVNNFTPACDAILKGDSLVKLPKLIAFARASGWIIKGSFILSLLYNLVGLSFAVEGTLSPVIAAILMPISSVSIVLFTLLGSTLAASRYGILK